MQIAEQGEAVVGIGETPLPQIGLLAATVAQRRAGGDDGLGRAAFVPERTPRLESLVLDHAEDDLLSPAGGENGVATLDRTHEQAHREAFAFG